jgi:hypothetical protein
MDMHAPTWEQKSTMVDPMSEEKESLFFWNFLQKMALFQFL